MTSLQLGLIAAGVALIVGVLVYNWLQERRVRRRIDRAFGKSATDGRTVPGAAAGSNQERVEPTLTRGDGDAHDARRGRPADDVTSATVARAPGIAVSDDAWTAPVEVLASAPADTMADVPPASAAAASVGARPSAPGKSIPQPDPDIECIVTLQPVRPVPAGAVAAGLHARPGKPLRWFGRRGVDLPWQPIKADTVGEFSEFAACLLLADRAGAASRPLLDGFVALIAEVAAAVPAAFVAPEIVHEAERAETLDRICADLDMQIGLTVLKPGPATIQGTRLRGVAEAAGFRLTDAGRFEWVQEDTGAVLYSLQNFRAEPFSAETLRLSSTPGVVFLLDVPRVVEPVRVFDQMKLAAKRMTLTLDATLVDDNRRPLDDAALAAIRQQVQAAVAALRDVNIEPGSPRALALFGG
jgi:hypothetical protein